MGITIGSNTSALNAQRRLAESSLGLEKVFERLSSGQRINRASDDAAGLAIASSLNSSARVFSQALRNVADGQSLLSIAESALGQLTDVGVRLKELATQSANGTFSQAQRNSISIEADELVKEYNRIIDSTSFNQRTLLNDPGFSLRIQAGYGVDGSIAFELANQIGSAVGDGTASITATLSYTSFSFISTPGDFNNDGNLDMILNGYLDSSIGVFLGNGDGTFQGATSYNVGGGPILGRVADLNRDGNLDLAVSNQADGTVSILLGNGDGSFGAHTTHEMSLDTNNPILVDLNGDSKIDLLTVGTGSVDIRLGNGDGTFGSRISQVNPGSSDSPTVADLNNDGKADLIYSSSDHEHTYIQLGNGDGTFGAVRSLLDVGGALTGDLNRDGNVDLLANDDFGNASVLLGNGDGTFSIFSTFTDGNAYSLLSDFNGDGLLDAVGLDISSKDLVIRFGNGDGSFKGAIISDAPAGTDLSYGGITDGINSDFDNDGVSDFIMLDFDAGEIYIALSNTSLSTRLGFLNLNSVSGAREAMDSMDALLGSIASELGKIGGVQSRLNSAANNLATAKTNYLAASGRILDADIATESAELVRLNILQQAGAAVASQANQLPQLAVNLLRS